MHDKALADEMELAFEPEQSLLLDSGFQGYARLGPGLPAGEKAHKRGA
jgi:hypothetical protein